VALGKNVLLRFTQNSFSPNKKLIKTLYTARHFHNIYANEDLGVNDIIRFIKHPIPQAQDLSCGVLQ
jgi:hypothetical protein